MAVVGVVSVPGLHRIALGQLGIGFLYLFPDGLPLIGTIADIVQHKELAFNYNISTSQHLRPNYVAGWPRDK